MTRRAERRNERYGIELLVDGGETRVRLARTQQLVGRAQGDYFTRIMSKTLAIVLTTVNAPYSEQLDGAALAYCLSDLALAKQHPGQVSAFLGEVPLAQQIEFAAAHHIAVKELKALAVQFAAWSGESYQLAA